jgi:hypothetical protein
LFSRIDLIPDDVENTDEDVRWLDYCQIAAQVSRPHGLDWALSDFDCDDSPLFEFIDDAITNPYEPGRPKANSMDLARRGKAILHLMATRVDDQVSMRMMLEG